jgi:TPR repeat protein
MYLGIAAGQGSNCAAYYLGMALARGKYSMKEHTEEAIYWLQKAVGDCLYNHLTVKGKNKAQCKLDEHS